ncbi:MAG: hypothetical protein U0232_06610 [Thermomicrobiales bacterium]
MVRATSRRIEALLASADPLQIDDETLTLVAAYDFHRDGLNKDDTRKVIEEVVAEVLGHPYRVRCVNQEDGSMISAPYRQRLRQQHLRRCPTSRRHPGPQPVAQAAQLAPAVVADDPPP